MHEANFTQEIVAAILMELKERGPCQAKQVRVKAGEMLHLVPESVRAHFQQMTKGTSLDGVSLLLEETPVEIKCMACGFIGGVLDHHVLFCSKCDSFQVQLLSGNEITIEEIEIIA